VMIRWDDDQLKAFEARIGANKGRTVRLLDREPSVPQVPKPTTSKYKNKKVQTEEASFASEKEHRRYLELKLLEKAGKICGLRLQVRFELADGYTRGKRKVPPLRYFADFTYIKIDESVHIVEDVKGFKTGVYRIKRHLMFTVHGIQILET
jgi:hypothetical protein